MKDQTYEGVVLPGDTLLLVGIGVGEALDLTSLATEKTVKVGSLRMLASEAKVLRGRVYQAWLAVCAAMTRVYSFRQNIPNLVTLTLLEVVALSAAGLEEVGALLRVT